MRCTRLSLMWPQSVRTGSRAAFSCIKLSPNTETGLKKRGKKERKRVRTFKKKEREDKTLKLVIHKCHRHKVTAHKCSLDFKKTTAIVCFYSFFVSLQHTMLDQWFSNYGTFTVSVRRET